MKIPHHRSQLLRCIILALLLSSWADVAVSSHNYTEDFDVAWGKENAKIHDGGHLVELSLDADIGSRITSKNRYLFGRFDLEMKLVQGESAGTITSFYISSGGSLNDEVDFEFLGNVSGEPYILHTNVFSQGKGGKEQQFFLWFDPTQDFHTYSILWNPFNIIFYVDGVPIRVFNNNEEHGAPFPTRQAVSVSASIWDAEDWATQGGRVKTNWSAAPFTASYRVYNAMNACVWRGKESGAECGGEPTWWKQKLDWWSWVTLNWVRMNYLLYDYCSDDRRFPEKYPPECYFPVGFHV